MPAAAWQAAPLIVPKPGSKSKYRLAIDLRPVNSPTVKESWPMPHLDSEVMDFAGSTCFASLEFVSAYWQLPLDPESYSACGIVTPKMVIASKRVLPGLANATSYFQSSVEPLFRELRQSLKAWLDDFTRQAKSEDYLLNLFDRFFAICAQHGHYFSAKKCRFFCQRMKWCGRIISRAGYTLNPMRLEGLRDMHLPRTAAELSEFIHCCRWMAITIPDFAKRIALLNKVMEAAYARSGKRTKRSIKSIALSSLSWTETHPEAFRDLQDSLRRAVTLSYPKPGLAICLFTDASELYWSGIVTQTKRENLDIPFDREVHEPLAFLGAEFKGTELGWSTFEKEANGIFQTFASWTICLWALNGLTFLPIIGIYCSYLLLSLSSRRSGDISFPKFKGGLSFYLGFPMLLNILMGKKTFLPTCSQDGQRGIALVQTSSRGQCLVCLRLQNKLFLPPRILSGLILTPSGPRKLQKSRDHRSYSMTDPRAFGRSAIVSGFQVRTWNYSSRSSPPHTVG